MGIHLYCSSCGAHYPEIQGGRLSAERAAIRVGWRLSEKWPARSWCVRLVCQAASREVASFGYVTPVEQLGLAGIR